MAGLVYSRCRPLQPSTAPETLMFPRIRFVVGALLLHTCAGLSLFGQEAGKRHDTEPSPVIPDEKLFGIKEKVRLNRKLPASMRICLSPDGKLAAECRRDG